MILDWDLGTLRQICKGTGEAEPWGGWGPEWEPLERGGSLLGGKAGQGARRVYNQTPWSLPQRVKAAQTPSG